MKYDSVAPSFFFFLLLDSSTSRPEVSRRRAVTCKLLMRLSLRRNWSIHLLYEILFTVTYCFFGGFFCNRGLRKFPVVSSVCVKHPVRPLSISRSLSQRQPAVFVFFFVVKSRHPLAGVAVVLDRQALRVQRKIDKRCSTRQSCFHC